MELSLFELMAAMGVVSLGAVVQGTIGFGMAVVSAPLLYMINPLLLPGPLIVATMVLGVLSSKRYARHIDYTSLGYAVVGRIPGSLLGAFMLTVASSRGLSLALGSSVLLAVAGSLTPYKIKATPGTLMGAGLCSGVMGTAVSIGGPPMALLMQNESGDRIRGNLAAFFIVGSGVSLAVLSFNGLFDIPRLLTGLSLFPAILCGYWVAGRIVSRVDRETIRRALLVLCSFSGLTAILSAWHG